MRANTRASGRIRIIGGAWRGRRLRFPGAAGLRPTPDRVRETLFNWLAPYIDGARCLDLFAGSGALGLEALSRGAADVCAVDRDRDIAAALRASAQKLETDQFRIECLDVLRFLAGATPTRRFDIVFLDPPHDSSLYSPVSQALECGGWLADHALLYVETAAGSENIADLPGCWRPHRAGRAGKVDYRLLRRDNAAG